MRLVRIGNGKAEKEAGYVAAEQDSATYVISAYRLGLSDEECFRYLRNKGLRDCPFARVLMQFATHTSCVS